MPTFRTRLVGAQFRPIEAQALVHALEEGSPVYLERDPENEFDPNAIKICADMDCSEHIGFVAAKHKDDIALASEIAEFMDLDTVYEAYVITPHNKSPLIEIEIFEEDGAA